MCKFVFTVCFGWLSTIPPPEVVNFLDHIREFCWQLNIRVKIGEFSFKRNVSVLWYYRFDFCFLFFPVRLNILDIERVSADFVVLGSGGCLSASSERKLHALFHSILEAVHRYR